MQGGAGLDRDLGEGCSSGRLRRIGTPLCSPSLFAGRLPEGGGLWRRELEGLARRAFWREPGPPG